MIEMNAKKVKDNGITEDIVDLVNEMLSDSFFSECVYKGFGFELGFGMARAKSNEVNPIPVIYVKPILTSTLEEYSICVPMPVSNDPLFPILITIVNNMVAKVKDKKGTLTKASLDTAYDIINKRLDSIKNIIVVRSSINKRNNTTLNIKELDKLNNELDFNLKTAYIRFTLGNPEIVNKTFNDIRSMDILGEDKHKVDISY